MQENEELIELLADKEHASWARWMHYLFSKCESLPDGSVLIPAELVTHWKRQTYTPYERLSEQEKQSDRNEVAHILPLIASSRDEIVKLRKQLSEANDLLFQHVELATLADKVIADLITKR